MFGYVKIQKSELRVREYEYYRAAYCGLCRSMGKCTGQCSRLTLSYDFAFLALMRMTLSGVAPTFKKRRCLVHLFHKRMMMEPNEALAFAADAAALLAYEKCLDDVADGGFFGRISARLRCLLLHAAYRRARKRHKALAVTLRTELAELSRIEGEKRPTVDEPAAVFGRLLAALMAEGLSDNAARIARVIGDKVGRFIYIVDAIDDLARDAKAGNYNPILLAFGESPDAAARETLRDALLVSLDDVSAALDLIPEDNDGTRRAILENIVYLGMPATAKQVLSKEDRSE
ncbi:MAG: hypothetical protein IJC99_02245 [Clostridia bacterium]|nr:hypothetical protein [Clostridia bacterium]